MKLVVKIIETKSTEYCEKGISIDVWEKYVAYAALIDRFMFKLQLEQELETD